MNSLLPLASRHRFGTLIDTAVLAYTRHPSLFNLRLPLLCFPGVKGAGHVGAAWRLDEAREKTAQAVEKLGFTTEGEVVPEVVIVSRRAEALRAEKRAEEAQRQAEEAQKRGVRKGEVQRRTRESVSGDSENATGATGSRGFWSAKGEARIMSMGSSSYLADSVGSATLWMNKNSLATFVPGADEERRWLICGHG